MTDRPQILCLGAMLWDVIGHSPIRLHQGDDVPGRIVQQPGGVALNVALALARLGLKPAMLSAVGCDPQGQALLLAVQREGVDTRWLLQSQDMQTDSYIAIESPDGLVSAIADARSLEAAGPAILAPLHDGRLGSAERPYDGQIIIDGNLTQAVLNGIGRDPLLKKARLRVVPASPDKAARLWPLLTHPDAIFHLNRAEAEVLTGRNFRSAARAAEAVLALGAARVIVTDGARLVADAKTGETTLVQEPPQLISVRVTGAGDTFLAGHCAAELAGKSRAEALDAGIAAAARHIAAKDLP